LARQKGEARGRWLAARLQAAVVEVVVCAGYLRILSGADAEGMWAEFQCAFFDLPAFPA
jgi:folate-dependent phosphoribosylglycinamide formyltransferase PurN